EWGDGFNGRGPATALCRLPGDGAWVFRAHRSGVYAGSRAVSRLPRAGPEGLRASRAGGGAATAEVGGVWARVAKRRASVPGPRADARRNRQDLGAEAGIVAGLVQVLRAAGGVDGKPGTDAAVAETGARSAGCIEHSGGDRVAGGAGPEPTAGRTRPGTA